ncbi:MAG TPA: hypothetical protein VML55_26580 [Planctomycetaceae bacterium]|nr:hypothetical protein [Planctomycetaceae bacterium]
MNASFAIRAKLALAAALVGLLSALHARAADKVPAERLLPPNVYAYVTFPDVSDLKNRWEDTLIGQLRQEKELAEFWRGVDAELEKLSRQVEERLGVSLSEIAAIPDGELAIAFAQEPGKKPALVALLDFGDSEETVDKLLKRAEEALVGDEVGATRSVREFEDTRIVAYAFNRDDDGDNGDAPAEKPFRQLAYFVRDSYLILGSDTAILESVLTRWSGDHDRTFGGNNVWQTVRDRTKHEDHTPVLTWYLNPMDMVKAALSAAGQGNPQVAFFFGLIPGLNKFKAVGGSFDMAVGDYDSISRTLIYVDLPAEGVLNLFQFPTDDLTPPKWVTAETASYTALNWDVESAYNTVAGLYDTFTFNPGAFNKMVDEAAEDPDGPGVHPKKDLVDQLTGRLYVLGLPVQIDAEADDEDDLAALNQRMLLAASVRDPGKIRDLLKKLAANPAFPGETREFRGETIYDLPIGGLFGDDSAGGGLGVAQGALVLTTDVTLLEQMLRGDSDAGPLSETEEYRRVVRRIPAQTSMMNFERTDAQLEALYELGRSEMAQDGLRDVLPDAEIDLSKLPPFEAIRKYLAPTAGYAVPDRDGALMVSFSLRRQAD